MGLEKLLATYEELPPWAHRIASSLLIVLFVYFADMLARRFIVARITDAEARHRARKVIDYTGLILTFFLVGRLWLAGFEDLSTFLGLLSAGLAVALQKPIADFAGFLFILWRRPFRMGDRIEIAGVRGDVIDVRLFQMSLLEVGNWVDADQSTGRVITIPNAKVFSDYQANYNSFFEFIWHEISVVVTFESDWTHAKKIIDAIGATEHQRVAPKAEEALKRAQTEHVIMYRNISPRVYTSVVEAGVRLTLRYLCEPKQRRDTEERVWEAILTQFHEHADIDFAYPTHRLYYNPRERKRPGQSRSG